MIWNFQHPGTIGVSCGDANRLLDAIEASGTEPHALLVMRRGIPAFEGYWAPYGPGIIHGDQSLTKTLTGIALGAAVTEGLLSLEDRLIDLFPEYARYTEGKKWWNELKVRHICTMGTGMESQPPVTDPEWVKKFFTVDIVHQPGTALYYNSIACSMVGACIRKKTGLGLIDFLTPRVFDKIGIDPKKIGWHKHADGLENGSGGWISTVRDNALLMELYRRGGLWDGERILSREWVDFALQVQNPHSDGPTYGGMMWMYPGFMMADGAMGQWSMLFPEKDLVISIQETITGDGTTERVRTALADFAAGLREEAVSWTEAETRAFKRRLSCLAIPAPHYGENPAALRQLDGRSLKVTEGKARFFADDLCIFSLAYDSPVDVFTFSVQNGNLVLGVTSRGKTVRCPVGMKGQRITWDVEPVSGNPARTACMAGAFEADGTLRLELRWLESCRVHYLTFRFDGDGADISTVRVPVGGFDVPEEKARGEWLKGESACRKS